MRKRLLPFGLVLLTSLTPSARADDFSYWSGAHLSYPAASRFEFTSHPEFRFDQDASRFHYFYIQNGFLFHAHRNLDLGIYHEFIETKTAAGLFRPEHREQFDLTPKVTRGPVALSLRNRFELRQGRQTPNRYRARIQTLLARPWTVLRLQPYVADEIFVDLSAGRYNQNRTTFGVLIPLNSRTQLNLFYLRRSALGTTGGWSHSDTLGTEIRLRLGEIKKG